MIPRVTASLAGEPYTEPGLTMTKPAAAVAEAWRNWRRRTFRSLMVASTPVPPRRSTGKLSGGDDSSMAGGNWQERRAIFAPALPPGLSGALAQRHGAVGARARPHLPPSARPLDEQRFIGGRAAQAEVDAGIAGGEIAS